MDVSRYLVNLTAIGARTKFATRVEQEWIISNS